MRDFNVVLCGLLAVALHASARATYQFRKRSFTDTCANVNAEVIPALGLFGLLNQCLCLSDIPEIVSEHGLWPIWDPNVANTISNLVTTAKGHTTCTFPDNSEPDCSSSNLCAWKCHSGFITQGLECKCRNPNTVCNGVCGSFPHGCSTSKPKPKRDILQRRATCSPGLTACGVFGANSAEAWECIDTKTELESCGGCMVGFGRNPAVGLDCTAIPGVMDVSCMAGSCAVQKCLPGYSVSNDSTHCLDANGAKPVTRPALSENELSVLAAAYGLQHAPLQKRAE